MSGTQGGGPDGPDPGLCARCRHAHVQRSARGSRFWRCGLADRDARFRRYPPLPVRACPGYAPGRGDGPEGDGAAPARGEEC